MKYLIFPEYSERLMDIRIEGARAICNYTHRVGTLCRLSIWSLKYYNSYKTRGGDGVKEWIGGSLIYRATSF